jgi:phosphatidylglycerol:prolipoprotein diacylglycerol transferase
MHSILFKLGPLTIYTYGFFVFLGVLSGYFVALNQAKKKGIDRNTFGNILFWTIILGFIGARLLYIIVERDNLMIDPLGIIFSRSGFVFYGGLIGGIAAFYFLVKKHKIDLLKAFDAVCLAVPLAHGFGRVGCFFYGCCFGRPMNNFLGMLFPADSPAGQLAIKVLPTQLIEAIFLFLFFGALLLVKKKQKYAGQIFIYYLIGYGIFRFALEFLRADFRGGLLGLSTSQIIAIVSVVTGIFIEQRMIKNRIKSKI